MVTPAVSVSRLDTYGPPKLRSHPPRLRMRKVQAIFRRSSVIGRSDSRSLSASFAPKSEFHSKMRSSDIILHQRKVLFLIFCVLRSRFARTPRDFLPTLLAHLVTTQRMISVGVRNDGSLSRTVDSSKRDAISAPLMFDFSLPGIAALQAREAASRWLERSNWCRRAIRYLETETGHIMGFHITGQPFL